MAKRLLGPLLVLGLLVLSGPVDARGNAGMNGSPQKLAQITRSTHSRTTTRAVIPTSSVHHRIKDDGHGHEIAGAVRPAALPIQEFTTCIPYNQGHDCDGNCTEGAGVTRCNSNAPHCATHYSELANSTASFYRFLSCTSTPEPSQSRTHTSSAVTTTSSLQPQFPVSTPPLTTFKPLPADPTDIISPFGFVIVQTITISNPKGSPKTRQKNPKVNYSGTNTQCASTSSAGSSSTGSRRVSKYRAMVIKREIVVGCLIGGLMVLIAGGLGAVLLWGWYRERRRNKGMKISSGSEVEKVQS